MANKETGSAPASGATVKTLVDPGDNFALPIEEYCTRLSLTDKRVELIGAFAHSETVAGRVKDTDAAYRDRFAAFATQPA